MEIRTRLTFQFIIVVASFLLASFIVIYISVEKNRQDLFYERLNKKAITAAELLFRVDQVDSTLLKLIARTERDRLFSENISIFNFENKIIYTNNDTIHDAKDLGISSQLLNEIRIEKKREFTFGDYELLGINYKYRKKTYVVIAGAIDVFGKTQRENLQIILLFLFFGILILVAIAGWIYSGRALAPISTVVNAVEKMSPEKLGERLKPLPNKDEIGRMVLTFNHLLDRIEDALNLQRIFVAGASHEMKNPLSAITSQLEVSLLKERTPETYRETIESVLEDIKKLNHITVQLMELARLDYGKSTIATQPVRVDEILWEAGQNLLKKNPDYQIDQVIVSLPENENDLYIPGNAALLQTAFENLADNACKYSTDKKVTISFQFVNGGVGIDFQDNGKGIKETELALVYEPFFRSAQNSGIRGTGLGLALVEKIVKLHKGSISITSSTGKGTLVSLWFSPKN